MERQMRAVAVLLFIAIAALLPLSCFAADDYNNNQYDENNAENQYEGYEMENGDDYIQYWTAYHIQPKRCVVYKGIDVIVFDVFGDDDQCSKTPQGTYYAPVPEYMEGWLSEIAQKMEDQGVDDYVPPESSDYQYCTQTQVDDSVYNLMLGCADNTTQSIAVNVYSDDQCENKLVYGDTDDSRIDISDIQVPFKKCQSCVNWVNKNDDQIDDQFYVNRQMLAPLCSTAWNYKENCGKKCQKIGLAEEKEGWTTSDLTLIITMLAFGSIVTGLIWRRRSRMPSKDALVEQAALASAGLQQIHIAAFGVVLLLLIAGAAWAGFKNLAFTLLLLVDFTLFAYFLKLTLDYSSPVEEIVGPDGQIITKVNSYDSDDESKESSVRPQHGTYMLPTLT
mmetsp:Transcript_5403/g.7066  ORF Transcript_5403/g.7066 Transcript_5403/m.7066 type:complete len:392 (-) Transcript_5403:201-1376(-)